METTYINSLKVCKIKSSKWLIPILILLFFGITKSVLLASVLGVSVSKAAQIAWAAYSAYRVGSSIRTAISPFLGWGALAWFALEIIISWGAAELVSSAHLQNL